MPVWDFHLFLSRNWFHESSRHTGSRESLHLANVFLALKADFLFPYLFSCSYIAFIALTYSCLLTRAAEVQGIAGEERNKFNSTSKSERVTDALAPALILLQWTRARETPALPKCVQPWGLDLSPKLDCCSWLADERKIQPPGTRCS